MQRRPLVRTIAALTLAALALFGTASCSSSGGDDATTTTEAEAGATTTTAAPDDETTTTPDGDEATDDDETTTTIDEDEGGDDEGSGDEPSWALPVTREGELLATIEGDDFTVDVYQVGTDVAPEDGSWVDPETDEPILKAGDDVVFVNYVVTNTSDEDIPLSFSLVDVEATYADWPYLQGMDSVVSDELYEAMGISDSAFTPEDHEAPFLWEAGTSFNYGDSFAHQPGGAILFEADLTRAGEDGELDHDTSQEAEAEGEIT